MKIGSPTQSEVIILIGLLSKHMTEVHLRLLRTENMLSFIIPSYLTT